MNIILNIGEGALIGAGHAVIGYIKSATTEDIDWQKAVPTVAIGAVVGGIASAMSIDIASAEAIAATYGVTAAVNAIWIAISKKYFNKPKNPGPVSANITG